MSGRPTASQQIATHWQPSHLQMHSNRQCQEYQLRWAASKYKSTRSIARMVAAVLYTFLLLQSARARLHSAFIHPTYSINSHVNQPSLHKLTYSSSTRLFYVQEPLKNTEASDESTSSTPNEEEETPTTESKDEVWMQATRTLGSLFLHQEDATRNVTTSTTSNDDGDGGGVFPFHESTLSSYLLNLKRQEEVNREKSKDVRVEDDNADSGEVERLSTEFQIDQVCFYMLIIATF